VLGYADEPGRSGPWDGLVDPLGQRPAVWFQRMDAPRPQRNRIHVDVSVPHDEAEPRIQAALAAGGMAEPIYDRTGGGQPPWVQIPLAEPQADRQDDCGRPAD